MLSITTPVVVLDSEKIPIYRARSKIEIPLDLYEYEVLCIGSALAGFMENMPCIYIIIKK